MQNEQPLTLEEISKIVDTMTEWANTGHIYVGTNEFLSIVADKDTSFWPWSKIRIISVNNRNPIIELGSIRGKHVLPLYQRIQELYRESDIKAEQEYEKIKNERIKEIRKK